MPRRMLPWVAAALLLPASARADSEVDQLKALVQRLERRVAELEKSNTRIEKSLETETLSEKEPSLTARLKAVEYQSAGMVKAARTVESLEGIKAGLSLTTVAQHPSGVPAGAPAEHSELNYRGDVYVGLPLDNIGDTTQQLFGTFRFGQGTGLNDLQAYSKPNASAFRVLSTKPDDSVAVLGQAWYQAQIPLPFGGFKPRSRESLEINFGKTDPFVFFDQNAAANDETRQFLNTAFVHNPLLDAGGDIGVDANGFSPGFRVSYHNFSAKPESWRLSLGVFGAGQGANYSRAFSSPLMIAQAEREVRLFEGLAGNYRAYYWRNGQGPDFTGLPARHAGFGLSLDQRYGDAVTLFGRYGQQLSGQVRFDRTLTLGAELGGSYWQRAADAIGAALGWMRTSSAFAAASPTLDANGDGIPDYGFAASGYESVLELYYRYRIAKQFELSPSFQYIAAPSGNQDAAAVKILGLRAQLTY
jgi:high affinity Mn2+ porin